MNKLKNQIVQLIQKKARRKIAVLAGEYVQAKPEKREAVQAGIDIEKWLAETCQESLDHPLKW